MDISTDLLAQPDVVMLDLRADSRETALRTLHARLARRGVVKNADQLLYDLLERVFLAPVCIATDVALPHARTDAVDRMVLGVARVLDQGVAFDAEHHFIKLIFMVGVPKQQVDEYLQMMAAISRVLRNESVKAGLLTAATEEEFCALLARGARK